MIVAKQKPLAAIFSMLEQFSKIFIVGCGTCVTVCLAGGEKEVHEVASALSLYRKGKDHQLEVVTKTIERQCEHEFVDQLKNEIESCDVVLSLGCGIGVQTITSRFPDKLVLPALDTKFMGLPVEQGIWEERCLGCGDCVLHLTYGICPVTRCSKSMLNGPCGGSTDGKCEIDKNLDCGWHLIYDCLVKLGKTAVMDELQPPKDWSKAYDGGPRKIVREDVLL